MLNSSLAYRGIRRTSYFSFGRGWYQIIRHGQWNGIAKKCLKGTPFHFQNIHIDTPICLCEQPEIVKSSLISQPVCISTRLYINYVIVNSCEYVVSLSFKYCCHEFFHILYIQFNKWIRLLLSGENNDNIRLLFVLFTNHNAAEPLLVGCF